MSDEQEISPREMACAFAPSLTALVENPLYNDVWTDSHLGFYAGFPAAISASAIANRVLPG